MTEKNDHYFFFIQINNYLNRNRISYTNNDELLIVFNYSDQFWMTNNYYHCLLLATWQKGLKYFVVASATSNGLRIHNVSSYFISRQPLAYRSNEAIHRFLKPRRNLCVCVYSVVVVGAIVSAPICTQLRLTLFQSTLDCCEFGRGIKLHPLKIKSHN